MTQKLLSLMLGLCFLNGIAQKKFIVKQQAGTTTQQTVSVPAVQKSFNTSGVNFNGEKCGSGKIHEYLMANDATYNANQVQLRKDIQQTIKDWKTGAKAPPPVYTVPVVFHVIHKGEAVGSGTNISDAQIQSVIPALNRDYRRTNADGGIALGAGPDTEIQFCLATVDPTGSPTTGINRVNGTTVSGYSTNGITSSNESQVKALSRWPNQNYVNIWIVSEIDNNGADLANPNNWTGGTLGYAYQPSNPVTANWQLDGIVVINICVGNDPSNSQGFHIWPWALLNRTLTHEMGHVLGLSHPFCDSNPSTCCDGDGLADTPLAKQVNLSSCSNPVSQGACSTQNIAIYMDYTPEDCQDMFSNDESNDMRAVLAGVRNQLTTSSSTNCTTCTPATVTITSTNPACGSNNGSATANATGGSTPYTYLWSNGGTTATINNLAAGTYSVTVTESGGCTTTQSVTLTTPGAPTVSASSVNVSAPGNCDGSATVTASGGVSPYTYSWSNGGTTATINNLCTGIYTVTVTGSNGCTGTATVTVSAPGTGCDTLVYFDGEIFYPQAIDTAGFVINAVDVDNDTPSPTLAAYGISSDWQIYSEVVSPGDTNLFIGATSWFATPGAADNWLNFGGVTIPSTGATLKWNYKIADNNYRDGYRVLINTTGANVSDFTSGGTVLKNVPDNDASTNGDTIWSPDSVAITAPFVGQKVYIAFHHNANDQFLIFFDDIVIADCNAGANCTGFNATATSTNTSCSGNTGTATASVTGGTTPYTYLWSTTPAQSTAIATGLAAGTYTVTVNDAGGCSVTASVTLTAPTPPTVSATSVDDTGGCNGSATAAASGGASPYTYLWSNGQTTATITGLCAGTYTVTVTASNGCTATTNVTVNGSTPTCDTLMYFDGQYFYPQAIDTAGFVINAVDMDNDTPNSALAAYGISSDWQIYSEVVSPGDTNLFIGATSYFAAPDTADNWLIFGGVTIPSTGAELTYDYMIADNGYRDGYRVLINTTGPNVSNFTSGGTVLKNVPDNDASTNGDTVWTNNSIQITAPFVGQKVYIAFHHNAYDQFLIFFDNIVIKDCNQSTCAGFNATVTSTNPTCGSSNGTATATATGGTSPYTYNWSTTPAQTTQTATGLGAGTYTVTVTSANSCTVTQSVTISSSNAPTVTVTSANTTCGSSNGSATANATGGTSPYTYLWSNSATTATITGVAAGTYTVTVTGANSCSATQSVTLTNIGTAPSVTATGTNASCGTNDGTATATATGGTTPYTYSWSNGGTTATINNLGAGVYTVTVTGGNCTGTASVTISGGGNMTANISSTNTNCPNTCTGQVQVAATGGTSPYTYQWSNGGTTAAQTGLCAGAYTVTVTDAASCTVIQQVNISSTSTTMFISTSSTNATCNNSNGTATVSVSGGTSPFTYLWSSTPPQTTTVATALSGGTYTAVVTDNVGCSDTVSVSVNNIGGVTATATSNPSTICEGDNAILVASGGTSYLWSNSATTNTTTVTPATTTTYYVTVTDNFQCSDSASVTVTVNQIPVTTVTASDTLICPGEPVTLTASGGTTYFWNVGGQTTATVVVAPSVTTTYSVQAQNGSCADMTPAIITVSVTQPAPNAMASADATTTYVAPPYNGLVNFSSQGSSGTSFSWDFNGDGTIDATTPTGSYNYSAAGTYNAILYVTLGGCTATDTLVITVQNQPPVGINQSAVSGWQLEVYPNPSEGKFNVRMSQYANVQMKIYNVLGEIIYFSTLTSTSTFIDISSQPSGVYYVNIQAGEKVITKKITVMKE